MRSLAPAPSLSRVTRPARPRSARPVVAASARPFVVPGDYRLGGGLLAVALFLGPGLHLWTQGALHGVLGGFLSLQASRVRFRFTDSALDVVIVEPFASDEAAAAAGTETSGENQLQGGGANKWALSTVVNWEFWWPGFPLLVYYKETQTRAEGQPHFFPIIMDGRALYEQMLAKMPPSVNAKPSPEAWCLDTALEATPVGRYVKTQLNAEQLAAVKKLTGLPLVDK